MSVPAAPAALDRLARGFGTFSLAVGRWAAWLGPAMMAVIVADVILRRYFVIGSVMLQELEWHLHGGLFLFCLGLAYLRGAHVRVELIWERWTPRTRAKVEIAGLVLAFLPYCSAILWFGVDYAEMAFRNQEVSASMTGLGARWIIKGALVAGFGVLLLAGFSMLVRLALTLRGSGAATDAELTRLLSDHQQTV